jgi:hypothetical protein
MIPTSRRSRRTVSLGTKLVHPIIDNMAVTCSVIYNKEKRKGKQEPKLHINCKAEK